MQQWPQVVQPAYHDANPSNEIRANPRVDNLYLDMNGIIHPWSPPAELRRPAAP